MRKLYSHFYSSACLVWITLQLGIAAAFTVRHWNEPWPDPILTIDGATYSEEAVKIAAGAGVTDFDHSPGYQVFLGYLVRVTGSLDEGVHWNKLASLCFLALTIFITWKEGRGWFSNETSQLAAVFLSSSVSLRYYVNMVQYESLLMFLLTCWVTLIIRASIVVKSSSRERLLFVSAMLACVIAGIQIRYAPVIAVPILVAVCAGQTSGLQSKNQRIVYGLIGAGLPLLIFTVCFFVLPELFAQQKNIFRFLVGNNPNALGVSFPYADVAEPSGWSFIVARPANFLWLMGQRFLYLWGIKPDLWAIPPGADSRTLLEVCVKTGQCFLFFSGWITYLARFGAIRSLPRATEIVLFCVPVIIFLPALTIFGSNRFLLPLMPVVSLFQAYGLNSLLQGIGRTINTKISDVHDRRSALQ